MLTKIKNYIKCQLGYHSWQNWTYQQGRYHCTELGTCKYCGSTTERTSDHEWSEWEYVLPNNCEQVRICSSCKTKETQTRHPSSLYKSATDESDYYPCPRCGSLLDYQEPPEPEGILSDEDKQAYGYPGNWFR